ncbi:CatB-related O-acetyltransferase [Polaribacter undariae]|uniref:CatB-related O-acetyltransferase n=1 Tax=Polaribacter sejongensis TaxID=985043 RepID=A0AAJ1QX17_9FLAO|nr:CatB-related O-acetyltransferase [Polaribacter undariae]MDN3619156.1 CatB-related O-acetyltransferase [Polaribacter undariae]UWD33643.1 CatB-related O-acetyltransferase [Polaribacter undariae]
MKPFKFLFFNKNSNISKTSKVYPFSLVRNSFIKDYSYISYSCTINNCTIGKFCSIAKGVKIGLGIHPINFISTSPIFYSNKNPLFESLVEQDTFEQSKHVYIGNDVWIGTNVVILDGISIGNGAIVGANSIVTKDVEPYSIVGGVAAKLIKKRFSESDVSKLEKINWWDMSINFFKSENVKNIFSKKLDTNTIIELEKLIKEYNENEFIK